MNLKIQKKSQVKKEKVQASELISTENPKYSDAVDFIQSAIYSLADDSKNGDAVAKDAIVNLSVILFDLKQ